MATWDSLTKAELFVVAQLCPGFTNALKKQPKPEIILHIQQQPPDVMQLSRLKQTSLLTLAKKCPGFDAREEKSLRKADLADFIKDHLPRFWPSQVQQGRKSGGSKKRSRPPVTDADLAGWDRDPDHLPAHLEFGHVKV